MLIPPIAFWSRTPAPTAGAPAPLAPEDYLLIPDIIEVSPGPFGLLFESETDFTITASPSGFIATKDV